MSEENRILKPFRLQDLRLGMNLGQSVYSKDGVKLLDKSTHITSYKQITKLEQAGVKSVIIDLTASVIGTETPRQIKKEREVFQQEIENPYEIVENLKHELEIARTIYRAANRVIEEVMNNARLGKNINNKGIIEAANSLIKSVLRNPQALLSMVNLKKQDEYTFNHSINVATISLSVARQLNMDEETMRQIGIGGLMHDIGKAKIPVNIINKPGRLTPEEFETIKQHTVLGVEICEKEELSSDVILDMVRHHHESYNGKGYPDNLNKNGLSKFASIIGIADMYDALTTIRSYKPKVPPPEAIHIIGTQANIRFDRRLVNHFVKIIGIYPVGSVVELSSGRLAVVVGFSSRNLLSPILKVLVNSDGTKHRGDELLILGENDDYISNYKPDFRFTGNLSDLL